MTRNNKGFAPLLVIIAALILIVGVFAATIYRLANPSVTLQSLTADIFRSSGFVDNTLTTTIIGITNKELIKGNYKTEKIEVTQRVQKGVRILELTLRSKSMNQTADEFDSFFKSLRTDFGSNSEIRKSFDGFELRIIGVGITSMWTKFDSR